jgi:hypothetical protein
MSSVTLVAPLAVLFFVGCDETMHSNYYDLGLPPFLHIGEPCTPDTPTASECGYPPQYYCTAAGSCASACNSTADCRDGSVCVGAGDMSVGECRLLLDMGGGGKG